MSEMTQPRSHGPLSSLEGVSERTLVMMLSRTVALQEFRFQSPGANLQEKSVNSRRHIVTRRVFLSFWDQFAAIGIACFKEPKTITKNFVSYTLTSVCACGTAVNAL